MTVSVWLRQSCMGDMDELGPRERCILPRLALGALSAAVWHGGVPGRGPQMKNAAQPLQSHSGCFWGRGGPFRSMPAAGGGELLSPSPSGGSGFPVCTTTPGSASQDLTCALLPSLLLRGSQRRS